MSLCYLCVRVLISVHPLILPGGNRSTASNASAVPNDTQLLQFSIGLPTHIYTFLSSFLLSFIFGMHHNSPVALLLQESEGIHRTASSETQALLDL